MSASEKAPLSKKAQEFIQYLQKQGQAQRERQAEESDPQAEAGRAYIRKFCEKIRKEEAEKREQQAKDEAAWVVLGDELDEWEMIEINE